MLRRAVGALLKGGAAATVAAPFAVGIYAQSEHEKQSFAALGLQGAWWAVADAYGLGSAVRDSGFPSRSGQVTRDTLEKCLRDGGTLTDPETRVKAFTRERFGAGGGFLGDMCANPLASAAARAAAAGAAADRLLAGQGEIRRRVRGPRDPQATEEDRRQVRPHRHHQRGPLP